LREIILSGAKRRAAGGQVSRGVIGYLAVVCAFEELREVDSENVSDFAEGANTNVFFPALDSAGKGPAEARTMGEVFLRPALPAAEMANTLP